MKGDAESGSLQPFLRQLKVSVQGFSKGGNVMKGNAELNALLLLTGNYHRLDTVWVRKGNGNSIEVLHVPKPLVDHFLEKIEELVVAERLKALELVEQAAKKYAAATE